MFDIGVRGVICLGVVGLGGRLGVINSSGPCCPVVVGVVVCRDVGDPSVYVVL